MVSLHANNERTARHLDAVYIIILIPYGLVLRSKIHLIGN